MTEPVKVCYVCGRRYPCETCHGGGAGPLGYMANCPDCEDGWREAEGHYLGEAPPHDGYHGIIGSDPERPDWIAHGGDDPAVLCPKCEEVKQCSGK